MAPCVAEAGGATANLGALTTGGAGGAWGAAASREPEATVGAAGWDASASRVARLHVLRRAGCLALPDPALSAEKRDPSTLAQGQGTADRGGASAAPCAAETGSATEVSGALVTRGTEGAWGAVASGASGESEATVGAAG